MMENNQIIAEFMGVDKHYEAQSSNMFNQYHTSWDRLMPVIGKCYQEHNRDAYFIQHNKHLLESIKNCDIDKAHQIVVGIINQKNYTEVYTATCYKCNEEIEYTDVFSMCPLCLQAI